MQNFEQQVQSMMNEHEVLVAVFTAETSIMDSMEAKRVFREFQMEILNREFPSLYRDVFYGRCRKTFIYGVTARMKADEEYLHRFLNACGDGTNITEIIGMTMNGTWPPKRKLICFLLASLASFFRPSGNQPRWLFQF